MQLFKNAMEIIVDDLSCSLNELPGMTVPWKKID